MEAKEDIRSRLNIEDVIGQYVQLKRAGRNFKGISPFSQEKTASFMVSPEKHIWHDFSSGKGGDIFTFVMEVEGIDFRGALELLARKAGVDLGQYEKTGDSGIGKKKEAIFSTLESATLFYQKSLITKVKDKQADSNEYSIAQNYIRKRKLTSQTVFEFKIGYAPKDGGVLKWVQDKGAEVETAIAAGLVSRMSGRYQREMFRGRITIPLMDAQGRVIGFTARLIQDEPNAPKYINTPQTLVYDKSRHVFGLHLAKEEIRQKDFAVIVEGNMDVIASHQVGVKNVVATAGTAITEYHLRTLSRFTQDVRLCFDSDKAGIAATERAIVLASNLGINLGIITVEGAKDADELINKDVLLWQQAISSPMDPIEWLLNHYSQLYGPQTAEGKRRITDRILAIIRTIEDPILVEHYLSVISRRIQSSTEALNKKLNQSAQPAKAELKPVARDNVRAPFSKNDNQDHLLAIALVHAPLRDILRKLETNEFDNEVRQHLADHLTNDAPLLQSDEIRVKIGELELIAETKYPALSDELYFDAAEMAKRIKREYKQKVRRDIARQFSETEDKQERDSLNERIKELDQQIEALKH